MGLLVEAGRGVLRQEQRLGGEHVAGGIPVARRQPWQGQAEDHDEERAEQPSLIAGLALIPGSAQAHGPSAPVAIDYVAVLDSAPAV